MRRSMILQGWHGDEYVLTPFVGASVVDRARAIARHEAGRRSGRADRSAPLLHTPFSRLTEHL